MAPKSKKAVPLLVEHKRDLLKRELEVAKEKHKFKMKEFEFLRESDRLHHEREKERGRIKSADIRRSLQHKEMISQGRPH